MTYLELKMMRFLSLNSQFYYYCYSSPAITFLFRLSIAPCLTFVFIFLFFPGITMRLVSHLILSCCVSAKKTFLNQGAK